MIDSERQVQFIMGEKHLVADFANSMGKDIAEILGSSLEFGVDACLDDGLLKDIPFIGTAFKLYSIGSKVHDKHCYMKLASFIQSVNSGDCTEEEVRKRKAKFAENASVREQELEYILILIDKYIGFDKPRMLAKIYLAYLDGDINWEELTIYAEIVDRFLPGDYAFLASNSTKFVTYANIGSEALLRLMALGLVAEEVSRAPLVSDGRGGWAVSASSINLANKKRKDYVRTEFGQRLVSIVK